MPITARMRQPNLMLTRAIGEMCVTKRRKDRGVTEDFLYGKQIDTGFEQMRGITMA